jgi:dihydroorotate dehydrogenase
MFKMMRALLFALEAERSHELTIAALAAFGRLPGPIRALTGTGPGGGSVELMGLRFPNRLGLAAGLDKNAVALEGLARLGFGFVEVGTVTPKPQAGNARPRLFRLIRERAIINRMGFNNDGVEVVAARLQAVRRRNRLGGTLIGVNVGKNRDTALEVAYRDYTTCMSAVYPHADYLTLNLSSPNTPGLRQLQTGEELERLLDAVTECREGLAARHGRRVPLLLKVAPDLHAEDVEAIAAAVHRFAIDAVIATNTTITRPEVAGSAHAGESGGLSGAPLAPLALARVREFRAALGAGVPIVGVGGISSAAQAQAFLDAGANLLQVYTGFIYEGPGLLRKLISSGHTGAC